MSGHIIQETAKIDLKKLLHKKGSSKTTIAETPPPVPLRPSMKPVRPHQAPTPPKDPPPSSMSDYLCPKCSLPEGTCTHTYEEIAAGSNRPDLEQHKYERPIKAETGQTGLNESNISTRLRMIEDNQTRMRNEFNDFRDTMDKNIKSIEASIKRLMEMVGSLDDSLTESFAYQQSLTDKMHTQMLESTDHLGKQVLDIKRDIMDAARSNTSGFSQLKKYKHVFEWDVGSLESLIKNQQSCSSQSFLIGQMDFKILGGLSCTRDGRLCVKMFGEFTHVPTNQWEKKNGNFECSAYIVDKSGQKSDLIVGKVTGDFNKEKTWMMGEVSAGEITVNGYTARGGHVNLKFIIEGYA